MPALRKLLRIKAGLSGDTVYALISTLGLAIGFAVFFLLGAEVRNAFSFDAHLPDRERIYLIKTRANYATNHGWKETTALPYRRVVAGSGMVTAWSTEIPYPATLRGPDGRLHAIDLTLVDPGFINIFAVPTLRGDMARALAEPHALSLGAALARDIFGRTDVVGETVRIAGEPYTVTAVHADPPSNTVVPFVALAGLQSAIFPDDERQHALDSWSQGTGRLFVKLAPGASPSQLEALVQQALDHSPLVDLVGPEMIQKLGSQKLIDLHFARLQDAYFDEEVGRTGENGKRASRRNIVALGCTACLVLLMAATSHAGLAASRALARQREIGIRKTLGASSSDIAWLFLGESALLSLAAIATGLLLAWLVAPLYLNATDMKMGVLFAPSFVASTSLVMLCVGTAAGLYPAWLAASIRTACMQTMHESSAPRVGSSLRQILTAVEFAATSACTVLAIAIAWQTNFAVRHDPGFDPQPLLTLKMPVYIQSPEAQSFRAALLRVPGVVGVTANLQAIGRDHWAHNIVLSYEGRGINFELKQISPDFFSVYGLQPVAGRLFNPETDRQGDYSMSVINAEAARELGFSSPETAVGKNLAYKTNGAIAYSRIIGVAPRIQFENLREAPRAVIYGLVTEAANLTVRFDGGASAKENVRHAIAAIWVRIFPNQILTVNDAADLYRQDYEVDARLALVMSAAAAIAVAISGFGMYVLAVLNVRGQTKEIVLRKLHGASERDIALFVARHTGWPVAAGTFAGIGIGAEAMHIYLREFVERAPMASWPLVIAFAVAFAIAVLASLRHTLMAMRLAPSIVLRQ